MILVRLEGSLGNQMFRYATVRQEIDTKRVFEKFLAIKKV